MRYRIDNALTRQKHVLIVFAVFILTACIHIDRHDFPESWGTLPSEADNVCTDIDGTFSVIGESDTGKYPLPLAYVFLTPSERKNWPPAKFDKTSYVTIEQAADIVTASVWAGATMIARKELRKDERNGYLCTPQGIATKGEFPNVHGLAGYVGQTYTLFKASDRGLIVKSEESGGGLALVIPVYASETFWYRYRPYHKP